MFVLRNSAELVSMFARKHFLSNLHEKYSKIIIFSTEWRFERKCFRANIPERYATASSTLFPLTSLAADNPKLDDATQRSAFCRAAGRQLCRQIFSCPQIFQSCRQAALPAIFSFPQIRGCIPISQTLDLLSSRPSQFNHSDAS